MKAECAWRCGAEPAPGGYITSTATTDLPGTLGIACEKLGLTVPSSAFATALPANATVASNAARKGWADMAGSCRKHNDFAPDRMHLEMEMLPRSPCRPSGSLVKLRLKHLPHFAV